MTKPARRGKQPALSRKTPAQPQVSAAQLFQQAQVALRFDDFDSAKDALRKATALEPQNASIIDAYASLLAELGDDSAKAALEQAIRIAPSSGHEKYMYLAQLEEEPERAIQLSSQGLELLHSRLTACQAAAAAPGGSTCRPQARPAS
ncbi:uncharacterized protein HaLaN_19706, partial [Haematococcus lacustris]